MNNFDPALDLETKVSTHSLNDQSTPIIATGKGSMALETELETHIKRLESDLNEATSRNLQLLDLLDQERRYTCYNPVLILKYVSFGENTVCSFNLLKFISIA